MGFYATDEGGVCVCGGGGGGGGGGEEIGMLCCTVSCM